MTLDIRNGVTNHWLSEEIRRERAEERIRQHRENAARGDERMCANDEHNMYEGEILFTPDGHLRCAPCKSRSACKNNEQRRAVRAARVKVRARPQLVDKRVRQAMETWHKEGSCRMPAVVDPTLFFSAEGEMGRKRKARIEQAKAICAQCPVIEQCRAYGLETHEQFGIWGGLTREERDEIWAAEKQANSRRQAA